jgi:xanthine/uracil permease
VIDPYLYVYAGTIAVFVLFAAAVAAFSLVIFSGIAIVHGIKEARRRKAPRRRLAAAPRRGRR